MIALRHALGYILLLGVLSACSIVPSWLGGGRSISSMTIVSEPQSNRNGAIAVDLVMVSSDDASAAVVKLAAHDWFQRRAQLESDYPDDIKVVSWELAPGQSVRDASIDSPGGLRDAIAFANYATPGDHRLRLGDNSHVRLTLGDTDLRIAP